MGLFKNIQENARMARYLRSYDALPDNIKAFFPEKEFIAEISQNWDIQRSYETVKWPTGWPLEFTGEISGLAEHFEWVRSEGARDEDIIWWWNLAPLERIIIKGMDYGTRRSAIFNLDKQGFKPEEVMKTVNKNFTIYTEDKRDVSLMTSQDREYFLSKHRPLPIELHNRIDLYFRGHLDSDSLSIIQEDRDNYGSMNAWARHMIEQGKI